MRLYITMLKNSIKGLSGKLAKTLVLGIRFFKISNVSLNHIGFICIGSFKAKQLYFALQKESKERTWNELKCITIIQPAKKMQSH